MLIEYAAGPEGENNKCLKHFSSNNVELYILCHIMHFVKIIAIKCPVKCNQLASLTLGHWGFFLEPLILLSWDCIVQDLLGVIL